MFEKTLALVDRAAQSCSGRRCAGFWFLQPAPQAGAR